MEDGVWRTVGGRRIFIKQGQDLATAMKESGKFKRLSVDSTNTIEKYVKPRLLEKIEFTEKEIEKTLNKYEKIIKNDKIENAIVITKNGEIYQCFGNKSNVWPDVDLKEKIKGSVITHNHPKEETNYSFSKADIELFKKYELSKLRGIDEKYIYELNRNNHSSLNNPTMCDKIEDCSLEHLISIKFAIANNISYKRWKDE